jgi:hypothetical protein
MARRPAGMKSSKEPEAGESSESQRPQKKYNRHTAQQIVHLEEYALSSFHLFFLHVNGSPLL